MIAQILEIEGKAVDLSLATPGAGEVTKCPLIYTHANLQEFRQHEYGRNRVKRYERQKTEPNRDQGEKNSPEGIQTKQEATRKEKNRKTVRGLTETVDQRSSRKWKWDRLSYADRKR